MSFLLVSSFLFSFKQSRQYFSFKTSRFSRKFYTLKLRLNFTTRCNNTSVIYQPPKNLDHFFQVLEQTILSKTLEKNQFIFGNLTGFSNIFCCFRYVVGTFTTFIFIHRLKNFFSMVIEISLLQLLPQHSPLLFLEGIFIMFWIGKIKVYVIS